MARQARLYEKWRNTQISILKGSKQSNFWLILLCVDTRLRGHDSTEQRPGSRIKCGMTGG